jgi:hypothetical protein
MRGFIVRPGGSREYLPKEYRGSPQDYYAHRMREAMRKRPNSIQMSRAAALEKDRLLDGEVARLRARYRQLASKTRLLHHSCGIAVKEKPRIRFAPLV